MVSPLIPIGLLKGSVVLLVLLACGLGVALALNLHRAKPKLDWIEFGFLVFVIGLGLALWFGLILASLGYFSLARLSVGLLGGAILGLAVEWKRAATTRLRLDLARPTRVEAGLLGLLALCAVIYFRPHEFVFGAADAGVYLNMGAHIARTGSLRVYDPELAELDPEVYPALFREQPPGTAARYYQFPGFYLSDSQPGVVIPQFFAVQAVSIGIFISIAGVQAGLYATPVWGVLGLASLYFMTRILFGRRAAFLATALLGFTATQIWFARYSTAEVLTQVYLFAGLYALARMLKGHTPAIGLGILAGASIGLIFLTRIDMILVAVVLVGALAGLAVSRRWQTGLTSFGFTFGLFIAHSIVHALIFAWPYTWNTYRSAFQILVGDRWPLMVVAGVSVLLVGGLGWRVYRQPSLDRSRVSQYARIGFVMLIVLAAGYAYFIRPYTESSRTVVNWYDEGTVVLTNPENLVRIGWYVTPLGLAVALFGVGLMCWRERSAAVNLFTTIGLLSTVVYVVNIMNNPHQIYAMRRYVPIVIPAITIWGAYGLSVASRIPDRRVVALVIIIVVGWLAGVLWQSRLIGRQVDYAGTLEALAALDRTLEPNAVVLMDDQSPVGLGDVLGTPLRYFFGHPVFVLRAPAKLPENWLAIAIDNWRRQGRKVYIIADATKGLSPAEGMSAALETRFTFETSILEWTYTHFPDQIVPIRYELNIYVVTPTG